MVEFLYNSLNCSNDNKISKEINLRKRLVIVPYYPFAVTELRNVLFINSVY